MKPRNLARRATLSLRAFIVTLCALLGAVTADAAPTTSDTPTAGAIYRIWSVGHSGCVLISASNYARHISQSSADETQYWQLEAQSDGTFALKNVSTGTYLGSNLTKNASFPMSTTAVGFTFATINTNYYTIKCGSSDYGLNATDQTYIATSGDGSATGNRVCAWDAGTSNTGSHWLFEKVYNSLDEYNNPSGLPETAYVFKNVQYSSNVLAVSGSNLAHVAASSADGTQYWTLVDTDDGQALYNLATQSYVQTTSWNTAYTMGSTASSFKISANSHNSSYYDIKDISGGNGLNATDNSISGGYYKVYNWAAYDGNNSNSAWTYEQVTLTDDMKTAIVNARKLITIKSALNNGAIRIKTRRSNGYYITDNAATSGNTCVLAAGKSSSDDSYYNQIWVVQASGSGYTLLNLATGKYLAPSSTSSSATTYYFYLNADNATNDEYVNFSKNSTQTGSGIHYQEYGNLVVEWAMDAGVGSDWLIEDVSDEITADIIKEKISELKGEVTSPTVGTYYIIRNMSNDNVMTEDYTNGVGTVVSRDTENYAQLWRLVSTSSDGYYNLQNALTGNYIQYTTFNIQHQISSSAPSGGFYLEAYNGESVKYHSYYAFRSNASSGKGTNYSIHRSGEILMTWWGYSESSQISGSLWYFQDPGLTEDQITAAQKAYQANQSEIKNASTYTTALATFFSDAACTTLKSEYTSYSDDNLKSAMANAGITSDVLQAMAVKVKNNAWATYEKEFRVSDLKPHSNPSTWANLLNLTQYSEVPNPTGIVGTTGSLAYIIVGGDVPDNCTLEARVVSSAASQGSKVSLTSGLNIINVSKGGALFLNYITPVTLTSEKTLADYPDIPIHIEGGTVNGYFDLTRSEIGTDEAWVAMRNAGLLTYDFMQMKGNHVIMNMTTSYVKQYVGDDEMENIVGFWDWVCKTEQELMGIDKYRTQNRWNDLEGCYSVTNSYMYATTYGTYYNETTLNVILNYSGMASAGGDLWGPAHEMGHNHQNLINVTGTTEISNNLFSAVAVYKNGRTSNRNGGKSTNDLANHFAAGDTWIDIQSDNWIPTHMFYQLYLYYEVMGHHPGFWAEVFDALRKDPIKKSYSSSSPAPSTNDFLHLAVKCCDVVQEDLSEFFEAYCMFIPFEARQVEDYATYYIENTADQIATAKAAMQKYSKPKGNILFADDHIKYFEAIDHDGNVLKDESGNTIMRTDYNAGEDAVGLLGDVGSFNDYVDGNYASGYSYTYSSGTITISSSEDGGASEAGAVGYKIYDSDGNLLYFSNKNTFTLPSSISDKVAAGTITLVVKVAQADGTDITLCAPGATTYTLKVYRADDTDENHCAVVYTDATSATLPAISDNNVVFIATENAPEALTQQTNYVNTDSKAYNFVLTDKKDFYAPSEFTATTLSYARSNTAGWNSVCLPFATEATDFGSGASIETFTRNNATTLTFTPIEGELAAGTPGIVYCPSDVTTWSITKQNAAVTPTAGSVTQGDATLTGSFFEEVIGEGKYKLNSSGTAFGITTAAGMVYPFRHYITLSGSGTREFGIEHAEPTAIHGATTSGTTNAPLYDLSGRRVMQPQRGGIYIQGGKKIVF